MSTADDLVADPGQDEAVIYEVTATGVAVLTLNRPDRLNTWGGDIATAFYAGLDRAEEDPGRPGDRADRSRQGVLRRRPAGFDGERRAVD